MTKPTLPQLVAGIEEMMTRRHQAHMAGKKQEEYRLDSEVMILQKRAAVLFGGERGWRFSGYGAFYLSALIPKQIQSRNRVFPSGYVDPRGFVDGFSPRDYADHPECFRKDRRPAALVAHLYHLPDDVEAWAATRGLKVEILPQEQSWYLPGGITPVVYTRLANATIAGRKAGRVNHRFWDRLQ